MGLYGKCGETGERKVVLCWGRERETERERERERERQRDRETERETERQTDSVEEEEKGKLG